MEGPARAPGRRWVSCVAAIVVLAALVVAVFGDPSALAGTGGQAGPSPVRVGLVPAHGALGGGPLRPGEPAFHPVRVRNEGTLPFRYDLTILAVGPLAGLVTVEVRAVAGSCDAAAFAAGDPVAGPVAMERLVRQGDRVLEPGAADRLCARVELPADAVAPADGGSTDAVLRVTAVQR